MPSKKRHTKDKAFMSKRSRTTLTLAQKKELCQKKENNPHLKHIEIANEYGIGESTVSEILKAKRQVVGVWGRLTSKKERSWEYYAEKKANKDLQLH